MEKSHVTGWASEMPTPAQLKEFFAQIETGRISKERLQEFLRGEQEKNKAADAVVRIFVDYTRPLADLIKAPGFDWVNSDITEKHFPITNRPNGDVEMKIFHFNRDMGSDEAIREMEKRGYRPAELPEALAYAKANPDEQRKYPILILGSVWRHWDGRRDFPYLWDGGSGRRLSLDWFDDEWRSGCRFLACRKS